MLNKTISNAKFVFTFPEEISRFLILECTVSSEQYYINTFYWDEIFGYDKLCYNSFANTNMTMTKSGNTFTIKSSDTHTWHCKVIYWPK